MPVCLPVSASGPWASWLSLRRLLGTAAPSAAGAASGFDFGVAAGDVELAARRSSGREPTAPGTALIQIGRERRFGPCNLAPARRRGCGPAPPRPTTTRSRSGSAACDPAPPTTTASACAAAPTASTGSFETAPAPNQAKTIRFAISGRPGRAARARRRARPFWNRFQIWNLIRARAQRLQRPARRHDLLRHRGARATASPNVATTVPQKWRKYRINLGQDPWARARGSAAYYAHWDDHEFINDFSPFENEFPLGVGRRARSTAGCSTSAGVKAFRNYNPISYSAQERDLPQLPLGQEPGDLLPRRALLPQPQRRLPGHLRQPARQRRPRPGADRSAEHPQPLLGHRAPARQPGAAAVHARRSTTPTGRCSATAQLARFKSAIQRSTATFKVIFNEVPIQQYYVDSLRPLGGLRGGAAEPAAVPRRQRRQRRLPDRRRTRQPRQRRPLADPRGGRARSTPGSPRSPPARSRPPPTRWRSATTTGNESAGALVHDAFLKPPPPNGVGMQCAAMDQFSYAQVTVTRNQLQVELRDIAQRPGQGHRRPSTRRSGARLRALRLQPRVAGASPAKRRRASAPPVTQLTPRAAIGADVSWVRAGSREG